MLHPDFSSGPASATPAAPAAPGGGLKILRNYHPDFAASAPATPAQPSGEVVDVDGDEDLSFIPDEQENEFGLDVTAGGKKAASEKPKPAELDIGESVDEYDFLRSDE
jgi:hypothetical protein